MSGLKSFLPVPSVTQQFTPEGWYARGGSEGALGALKAGYTASNVALSDESSVEFRLMVEEAEAAYRNLMEAVSNLEGFIHD